MTHAPAPADSPFVTGRGLPSRYRWWVVVLLFFSTTINYVDRALFSNLVPYFEGDASLRLGPMDLAYINVAFLLSYGLGMIFVGRFVDRVGVWVGLAITFFVWNVASVGHALAFSVTGFVLIRILLGLGEAGNFPSAVKAVAEWFPKRERALATGWFNCGSNVGAVLTPLSVPFIADRYGWRVAFAILGGVGIVWLFFWLAMYRRPEVHPRVSPEELAFIQSDPPEPAGRIPALALLAQRQVYGYALARFFTEAPWWFYLTWVPKILADTYGLTSYQRAWAIAVVYVVADFGAVGGGWISSRMIKRGATVNAARKTGLLIAALGTVPMISVAWMQGVQTGSFSMVWVVVPLLSLAAASHQAWSSNLYTVISDTLPKNAVATTVGIGSAFGAVGSSIFQVMVAVWLLKTQSYTLPFLFAGSLYLVGLGVLHLILPRLDPARIDEHTRTRLRWWQVAVGGAALVAVLVGLQLWLNRPAYRDAADYYAKRAGQLGATTHVVGPAAKVGWQDATWVRWDTPAGGRWELVKFDRHGRPLVETKGAAAKRYEGPATGALTPTIP